MVGVRANNKEGPKGFIPGGPFLSAGGVPTCLHFVCGMVQCLVKGVRELDVMQVIENLLSDVRLLERRLERLNDFLNGEITLEELEGQANEGD